MSITFLDPDSLEMGFEDKKMHIKRHNHFKSWTVPEKKKLEEDNNITVFSFNASQRFKLVSSNQQQLPFPFVILQSCSKFNVLQPSYIILSTTSMSYSLHIFVSTIRISIIYVLTICVHENIYSYHFHPQLSNGLFLYF
ncbi:hypothetical protein N665_0098s0059 [Sinapis alba]|nr:hypothetical protein N665_0098s0059 [Sinapis alba]